VSLSFLPWANSGAALTSALPVVFKLRFFYSTAQYVEWNKKQRNKVRDSCCNESLLLGDWRLRSSRRMGSWDLVAAANGDADYRSMATMLPSTDRPVLRAAEQKKEKLIFHFPRWVI